MDSEPVWRRIVNHSGEIFHQIREKALTYEARGRNDSSPYNHLDDQPQRN